MIAQTISDAGVAFLVIGVCLAGVLAMIVSGSWRRRK